MANKKDVYIPTVGEEIANTVTHGVMSLVALVALPFAAVWAYVHDPNPVTASVSVSIFVISIFLMFLASTLYHSMNPASKHKAVFHILDHIFIYVAIAGSYTPIALSVIGGWQGIFITILQWAMVLFGIFYKSLSRNSIPAISLTIYLVMGWTIIFFLPLFVRQASTALLVLMGLGMFIAIVFYGSVFSLSSLSFAAWLVLVALALLVVPIQIGLEMLFDRCSALLARRAERKARRRTARGASRSRR